jgi:hypothetical protein
LALTPGVRLGVYEVTALIGEGRMGHVYWATDAKLKRQVAIKVLPLALLLTSSLLVLLSAHEPLSNSRTADRTTASAIDPRTPDGRPDLQGIWDYGTLTPLQRPPEFAGKPSLTDEEAARFEQETRARQDTDTIDPNRGPADLNRAPFNNFWWDRGRGLARVDGAVLSSLIIDPADGKVPSLTSAGEKRSVSQELVMQQNLADGPEQRRLSERCLADRGGPPMTPGTDMNYLQIVQTPDYVVLFTEISNTARIVPLDGRPQLPQGVRQWRGDVRGRWVADTLIIDTTNMIQGAALSSTRSVVGPSLHLIERLTRVDADTLRYEFTVDAPDTYVRPWTAVVPMRRSDDRMFEAACHEGNYALEGILRGARAQDKMRRTP